MAINGVFFGGRRLVRSQAYAVVDATRMAGLQLGAPRTMVLLGDAKGGTPGEILKFGSPSEARKTLRGGDLAKAVELAFAPSKDLRGAQEVWAIRLNPATQATKTLQDSVPANVLALTSRDYGVWTNEIEVKVASATNAGKHIYIRHIPSGAIEEQDDLQDVFAIQYSGNASAATMTITVTSGNAVTLATTLTGATDGSVSLSIDLTNPSYNTVAKLAAFINGQQGYSVTYSDRLKNQALAVSYLDAAAAVDIKTGAYTATAKLGAIIDWINNNSVLISAAKSVSTAVNAPANIAYSALGSGTDGSTTSTQWTAALTLLEQEVVNYIVPITTSSAFQQMVHNHVLTMRGIGRLRKGVYGHAIGATIPQIKALAVGFNSEAGILATPGIKLYNENNVLTTYDSSYTAAALAGMACGLDNVAVPLTGHYVNCLGVEVQYTDSEVDGLITAGVLPIRYEKNKGWEISLACTTYLKSDNILYQEWSVSDIADYISEDMKGYLESLYKGKPASKATISTLKTDVTGRLKMYERIGIITGGVDRNSGEVVEAYRNIQVRYSAGAVYIDYEISPVEPMNWILITTHAVSIDIVA